MTEYSIQDGTLTLRINTKVYPSDRVFATAYIYLDQYYFVFDGDRDSEIIVRVTPKAEQSDLDAFAKKFLEELLSQSNYFMQFEKNKNIIELILKRALQSIEPIPLSPEEEAALERILS